MVDKTMHSLNIIFMANEQNTIWALPSMSTSSETMTVALRRAKTLQSFDHSECSRVNLPLYLQMIRTLG